MVAIYEDMETKKDDSGHEYMESMKRNLEDLRYEISYIKDWVKELNTALYRHKGEGHLPNVPSVSQMKRVLEILELDSEFEVEKNKMWIESPVGYSSTVAGSKCLEF